MLLCEVAILLLRLISMDGSQKTSEESLYAPQGLHMKDSGESRDYLRWLKLKFSLKQAFFACCSYANPARVKKKSHSSL